MNEEKMTLKESVRLTLRAWRFYWKNTPRFVLSTVLWALADAVSPYAVVWFSARLVAELSDARDPQALAVDVAWVLGVTALLTLVRSVLLHWKGVEREQLNWQLGHDCFMEKQMSMDYADEDSQQVYDLYNFIQQSESFCGSEQYALRHLSMTFKVGERLAVVGMNGSGKTTFIKLLCRLYDPTEGVILLNGIDIRKYRYDEYMDIFSVVFQDFKLFSLPLGQNVATAQHYDAARAADCLQKAGFSDRLARMPKGLDTCLYKDLDEDGVTISGGEAQKIAIARALYKDAPFIVLDEPTAALDPVAEAEIYAKFNEIAGDKTAIYISHRLSSCKFCDEIAVFDHGEVVQQGTHEELLGEPDGKYYELWNAQAQYYTEESA